MSESGENVMGDATRLLGKCPVEPGMIVAEEIDPPGGNPVDISFPFEVDKMDSLSPLDGDGREEFMVLLLGAGMPDVFSVQS
jgi:hypothetical protein